MNPEIKDLLHEIDSVDLSVSNLQRMESNFDLWFGMIEKWNRSINLVSRSSPRLVDHLYDSLQYLRVLPKEASFLDLGSGAGFPGVALKIVRPACEAVFLEGRKKRANFLKILTKASQRPLGNNFFWQLPQLLSRYQN